MFRCMFAVTWYEYCCPNAMLAERRKRTTTCKKCSPALGTLRAFYMTAYGVSWRVENHVTMQTVSWLHVVFLMLTKTL